MGSHDNTSALTQSPSPLLPVSKPIPPPPPPPPPTKLKKLILPLTILTYLLSLPVLAAAVWLLYTSDYDCEELLRMPRLRVAVGIALLLVFVVNNAVVFLGRRALLPGLLAIMVPVVLMLIGGLTLVGTYNMESRGVPASPSWLRMRVSQSVIWTNVKTCIFDTRICSDLSFRTVQLTSYDFSMKRLSAIESGCCKPPALCGMKYVNATYWIPSTGTGGDDEGWTLPRNPAASAASFGDCGAWDNDPRKLCYNCMTCKVGFLTTIQWRWQRLGVFLTVMSVFLATAHVLLFILQMLERHK